MITCSKCGSETAVADSRPCGAYIRRRRKCIACGTRMTTIEAVVRRKGPRAEIAALERMDEMVAGIEAIHSLVVSLMRIAPRPSGEVRLPPESMR